MFFLHTIKRSLPINRLESLILTLIRLSTSFLTAILATLFMQATFAVVLYLLDSQLNWYSVFCLLLGIYWATFDKNLKELDAEFN